jgi:hypothetical protein
MRKTISSSAELLGAQTSTLVRLLSVSPTTSGFSGGGGGTGGASRGGGGASRGFGTPHIHGAARRCTEAFSAGERGLRSSRVSRKRLRSISWPLLTPGTAWRMTERRERMIRVLPVPGGPCISVMGCFSSAALRAVSWLSARVRRIEKDERVSIHRSG